MIFALLGVLWVASLFGLYALVREKPFTYHPTLYAYSYAIPSVHPMPWRDHVRVSEFYILPTELVLSFVEDNHLVYIRNTEEEKQIELEEDLLTNGLREPLSMYVDENGKVRYQDGHHRMEIMRKHLLLFPVVPVLLMKTSKIRAYGRPLHHEIEQIFSLLSLP